MIPKSCTPFGKFGRFSMAEHFHGARMWDWELRKGRVSRCKLKFVEDSNKEFVFGFYSTGISATNLPKFAPRRGASMLCNRRSYFENEGANFSHATL